MCVFLSGHYIVSLLCFKLDLSVIRHCNQALVFSAGTNVTDCNSVVIALRRVSVCLLLKVEDVKNSRCGFRFHSE